MNRKETLIYTILAITLVISVISLSISAPRGKLLDFDYIGVIIGLFSLIVTILIGWQIYSTINIKNVISKEVETGLKDFEQRSLQAIINSQYVIIMREYQINKKIGDYNKVVFNMATALHLASMVGNVDKIKFCINILNEIIENREGDILLDIEYIEDLSDALYKCTSISQESINLLKKINVTILSKK